MLAQYSRSWSVGSVSWMPPVSDPGAAALTSKVGLRINPKRKIKKLKLVRCFIIFGLCSVEILWIAKGWIKQDSGFYKKNPRWRNRMKILRFFCSKKSLQNNISAFRLFWSSWNLLKVSSIHRWIQKYQYCRQPQNADGPNHQSDFHSSSVDWVRGILAAALRLILFELMVDT